jgi:ribonuclease Z
MYSAELINDPFGDPGVYVGCKYRRESLLFDLGDLHHLTPRKLLKVGYVFVSHTHMDHFIGFDRLLRLFLGRDKHLHLFGPPGFLAHLEHKLRAYSWNLVENYTNDFTIIATEVSAEGMIVNRYECRRTFAPEIVEKGRPFDGVLAETDFFKVRAAILDHKIPCLAFCFEERKRFNILKTVLDEMDLPTGAWLMTLKEHLLNGDDDESPVRICRRDHEGNRQETWRPLGELRQVVKITPGLKIAYVVDAVYNQENHAAILKLIDKADMLFIETPFLDEDAETAAKKYHLTARQAGLLAKEAQVKRIIPLHFSPKYKPTPLALAEEAMNAFKGNPGTNL